jgi:opacity protein-like surface antigen
MRGNGISRRVGIAVAAMLAVTVGTFSHPANAQTGNCGWIDAKTGEPYPSGSLVPLGMKEINFQADPNHYTTPSGRNFVRDPALGWIDAKTGQPYPSGSLVPLGMREINFQADPNHYTTPSGRNFVRVPCPPTSTASSTIGSGYRTPGISPDGNSGIRFLVNVEGGFAGARAFYDDLSIDPRSFIGGASAGVRSYQPYNMFLGAQVSVLGTDLTREAVPRLTVGLEWGVPVDVQVGRTFQAGATPFAVYGFAGPMWGRTRVSEFGNTDYFTLFGVTAGVGLEVQLNQNWSVGAKARGFTLGPSDRRSEGQHVEGGSLTFNVGYAF